MPGHDDTLNAGGPQVDPLDELCTCGHTRGEHHTIDEACCEDGCACCAFQVVNPEFGNGQPSEAQLQAQLDAHAKIHPSNRKRPEFDAALDKAVEDFNEEHGVDLLADTLRANKAIADASLAGNLHKLTADLPKDGGRIEAIGDALDAVLDDALLCSDESCGHRRDRHKHDGCNDCACPVFLEPPETLKVPAILRQANATRNNTREASDRWSNDARAAAMDREAMSPTEAMTDEERTESDVVQAETLDNLCTCGHRYGDHASNYGELCLDADCECVEFEALLKPADLEFADDSPADPQAIARAARRPESPRVGRMIEHPFRRTCCAACGHEKVDHDHTEPHACLGAECACGAFIEYTGGIDPKGLTFAHDENIGPAPEDIVDASGRKPYTPPLLRKKYIGEDELRKILADAGRLDLLPDLPEVDRVTTNYGAGHWQEIERLARFPQGSSGTVRPEAQQLKAIALALLDLRQSLGATNYTETLVKHIETNAEIIRRTGETLDRVVDRILGAEGK